ncbi:hypothetical protein [Streptomyces sp. NPDC059169]|uniref:hypothetical protein n=1 Tax=unclassified Streptomyces TaxID=2593676 RepID=UPI00368AFD7E
MITQLERAGVSAELEILLRGMGLPFASGVDRRDAVGVVIKSLHDRAATVEWLASVPLRKAAAQEQVEGFAEGNAGVLHRTARAHVHAAITAFLQHLGYSVADDAAGLLVRKCSGSSTGAVAAVGLYECGLAWPMLCPPDDLDDGGRYVPSMPRQTVGHEADGSSR